MTANTLYGSDLSHPVSIAQSSECAEGVINQTRTEDIHFL